MYTDAVSYYDRYKLDPPEQHSVEEVYDRDRAFGSVTDEMVSEWLEDEELERTPENVARAEKAIVDSIMDEWYPK
jgi:hypothetical protein